MKRTQRCILVWSGSPQLLNHGDITMLQVTVRRLRRLCPQHRILVFVDSGDLLERYCPGAEPLDKVTFDLRQCRLLAPESILRIAPNSAQAWVREKQTQLLARSSTTYRLVTRAKARLKGNGAGDPKAAFELLAHTDAIVSTGGGFVNDSFPSVAQRVMRDLKLGASLSIPVAMFGQGLGPVTNAGVLQSAGELFPTLAVIGLREGRQSYGLAARWAGGVSPRIRVTGDDAIEPVYSLHRPEWGESIGVNVRVANYSGVDRYQVLHLAEVLRSAAAMTKAPLLPIVISRHPDESDAENLRALLSDGQLLSSEADYDTPEKAVSAVARCRVVVTGSYHAGVFALAQGIPVIGLVADKYYEAKFLGLSHQFGCGVEMVWLDRQDFGSQLLRLIRAMWDAAPTFREQLLSSARDQIELGERAYADFAAVVQQKAAGGLNSSNSTDRTRIGLSASRL